MAMPHHSRFVRTPNSRLVPFVVTAAICVFATGLLAGCGESADDTAATDTTLTEASATTDTPTTASTGTSDAPASSVPPAQKSETTTVAIWPFRDGDTIYEDPVALADAFASEYLGFTRLEVDDFEAADENSGRVAVRSFTNGTPTVIDVARLDPTGGWVVLGATNEHLVVTSPDRGSTVTGPVAVSGESTAFEGTVDVMVREFGRMDPIGQGFATGGANGEMGPFTTLIDLAEGGAEHGAVIVSTTSMEDGGTQEATVVSVMFG